MSAVVDRPNVTERQRGQKEPRIRRCKSQTAADKPNQHCSTLCVLPRLTAPGLLICASSRARVAAVGEYYKLGHRSTWAT